ncbi:MAG: tail fiber protein [Chloroflexota bacterium]
MSDPFIGEIRVFAGTFAPRDWAFCNGQTIPVEQNGALFAIISALYGGNGRTDFALPDLQARAPMHAGLGPGLTDRRLSQQLGTNNVTLNNSNMPTHNHTFGGRAPGLTRQVESSPAGHTVRGSVTLYDDVGGTTTSLAGTALDSVGANGAHENRHPVLAINFIIALNGLFPTQN